MDKQVPTTLLFTDIEGSTRIANHLGQDYAVLLGAHNQLISNAVKLYGGEEIENPGDGFFIQFSDPNRALRAVIHMQQEIHQRDWPHGVKLKVRMALHYGTVTRLSLGYAGIEIHRTSRVCNSAYGGQVLLTRQFVDHLDSASEFNLKKLGSYYLKDFEDPIELFQVNILSEDDRYPLLRTTSAEPVIAVIPFANPMNDRDSNSLCEGIAEELIIALGRIPGLRVISRSASFNVDRQSGLDVHTLASHLQASAILSGSLRKQSDKIHINVELVDGGSGQNLWAQHFERSKSELFAIQDEIRMGVARVLQLGIEEYEIRDIQEVQTHDIVAYEYYLKGRRFYDQFSLESIKFARRMFEKAIAVDNRYALAYCGLADCFSYICMYCNASENNKSSARVYSDNALELDPGLAEAWVSRGIVYSIDREYDKAKEMFLRAVQLDPRLYEAAYQFARMTFASGDYEKAAMLFEKAHSLRPDEYQALLLAGQCYEAIGLKQKSLEVRSKGIGQVEENLKLNPGDTRALYMGANGLASLGSKSKALEWLQRALILLPDDAMLLYNAGCIYAMCQMPDEAMSCIEKCVREGLNQADWLTHDPDLEPIRTMERYQSLLEAMNKKEASSTAC